MTPRLNFHIKLQLVNLKDQENLSFRDIAAKTGIPKSTVYDNINVARQQVGAFHSAIKKDPVERLVRTTLIMAMEGKCSSRDLALSISSIWQTSISQQTVLKILDLSSDVAKKFNQELNFKAVQSALFDEIFQNAQPVLAFADAASGLIYIEESIDRKGDSWELVLRQLKALGLNPQTFITDGGKGILGGIDRVFGSVNIVRDLFHVLRKLSKALDIMENKCYRILANSYEHEKKNEVDTAKKMMKEFDEAAMIFEKLERGMRRFRFSCYLGHPDSDEGYVDSKTLLMIITDLCDNLFLFKEKFSSHKAIHNAWTYLKNGDTNIIAYKETIEKYVEESFGRQFQEMVLEHLSPLIEYINQYLRAHDNNAKRDFWGKKIAKLRQRFRSYSVIDQSEVDKAINFVWAIGLKSCKSNSYIESVNSVIRRYLSTYQSIPSWFCSLFTYYWNNREFARGKRAGKSPLTLLTGAEQSSWVDAIIKEFPLDKLRKGLPAVPGFFNPDWDEPVRPQKRQILQATG